jgi:hypothetical protein
LRHLSTPLLRQSDYASGNPGLHVILVEVDTRHESRTEILQFYLREETMAIDPENGDGGTEKGLMLVHQTDPTSQDKFEGTC